MPQKKSASQPVAKKSAPRAGTTKKPPGYGYQAAGKGVKTNEKMGRPPAKKMASALNPLGSMIDTRKKRG